MNSHAFQFHGALLHALPSGALHWPEARVLVVSDLHLGKSARLAEAGGAALPPYDTQETLNTLESDIFLSDAAHVICLGDSFDSAAIAGALPDREKLWITRLQAGRRWSWIEGNHDPGPLELGGSHHKALQINGLWFRHIASPDAAGEVSGHYHPKARLTVRGRRFSLPCFLLDSRRLILPAYGAYTGGLFCDGPVLSALMDSDAQAILTGPRPVAIPMPRG